MTLQHARTIRLSARALCVLGVLSFIQRPSTVHAASKDETEIKIAKGAATERYEREVDEVALASQDKAIQRLHSLLKKYQGKSQEPILLAKLADVQQQAAAMVFRIAHGLAENRGGQAKTLDLSRYHRIMNDAIKTFSTLIAKYPNYEEIPHAYFGRGKGYEEIGNIQKATSDYLHLVKTFPDAEDTVSAYMSLAEFAIQANDHPKAITYLKQVEKHEESPFFPFALYKLAWSHYNLKDIPSALSYAERQVAYYNARTPKDSDKDAKNPENDVLSSDDAIKENTLVDIPVFYFEGYEEKAPAYALSNALHYFKKIEEGKALGKMLVRFAKLLRSHNHEDDLISWKNQVLQAESDRNESLDVVLISLEFLINKRKYPEIVATTQDIIKLYKKGNLYEAMPRAQKMVLDTAENLQQLVIKNKDATEVREYSTYLASIYDAFTHMVDEKDPRIPRVHYNLAETLFAIKDFQGATDHYRWIVDHQEWSTIAAGSKAKPEKGTPAEQGSVADSSLKAIAARYEVLRQKKLIPTELSPKSLTKDSDRALDPLLSQWTQWIDTHFKHESQGLDNFMFEADRALYAQDHLVQSMEKLLSFIKTYPKSQYTTPSASLVLDTLIATEDWDKTHAQAVEFMKNPEWKTGDFSKRLFVVASDAFYKKTESLYRAKDYKNALKNVDEFLAKYAESGRLADALTLAGNAALASNDKKKANEYYSRLIAEASKANGKSINMGNLGAAFLARASLAEEHYEFSAAASDYRAFFLLPAQAVKVEATKADDLRRKTLTLVWLGNDPVELQSMLDNKAICTDALAADCEKFRTLAILANPERARSSEMTETAFDKARKDGASKETRALWAVIALEGSKKLAFRDRNLAIRVITNNWTEIDPLARFAVLPYLTVSIPKAFQLNRAAMKDVAPLRADEKYITHRVDMIREMENAATRAVKLPWSRIRAEVLNEIAGLYLDLASGLSALSPPKGLNDAELAAYQETIRKLVMPFEEKGQDMRSKAFEIASRFAIEEDSFLRIVEPFFTENPSQAKKLRSGTAAVANPATISLEFLSKIDPQGKWTFTKKEKSGEQDSAALVKSLWSSALQNHRWQQVAYFMQEAKEKSYISDQTYGIVKAISLAQAGARGEALTELEETRKKLSDEGRMAVLTMLLQHYQHAYAQDKAQTFSKEIESELSAQKEGKTRK